MDGKREDMGSLSFPSPYWLPYPLTRATRFQSVGQYKFKEAIMFTDLVFFTLGAAGGYFVPALMKKWLGNAEQFAKDVEKKL